ncbi:MAG: ribbon-helix-helix protein, CopG family [Actinomycetota bacterium]
MKTAISLPDELFEAADRLARRLRLSRSELYARALNRFVEQHRDDGVTRVLDAVYRDVESALDPAVARLQSTSLEPGEW